MSAPIVQNSRKRFSLVLGATAFLIALLAAVHAHSAGAGLPSQDRPMTPYEQEDVRLSARAAATADAALHWSEISTGVGAVGTILVVLTVVYSARSTRVAAKGASAAFQMLELERDTAHRSLRPYVAFEEPRIRLITAPGNVAHPRWHMLDIGWNNVGETPAEDCTTGVNIVGFLPEMPPDYDFPDLAEAHYLGLIGSEKSVKNSIQMPLKILSASYESGGPVHLWAWIEYESHPDAARHRTEWHGRVEMSGDPRKKDTIYRFVVMNKFNGSDRYCYRHPVRNSVVPTMRSRFLNDYRVTKRKSQITPPVILPPANTNVIPPQHRWS